MKAMLYADWQNFRQTIKSLLFVIVVLALAGFFVNGPSFFYMIIVMISIMLPLTLCSADKAYGWDRLSLSMPILRRDVVGSKFILSALSSAIMTVMAIGMILGYRLLHPEEPLWEHIAGALLCEAIALVLIGVMLLSVIKWGVEKGRYIVMACVWIPILAAFLLSKLDMPKPDLTWLKQLTDWHLPAFAGALLGAAALIYLACYAIAVRTYQKTEL